MKDPLLKFWNGGEYISAVLRHKVIVKMIVWHYVFVSFTYSQIGSVISQKIKIIFSKCQVDKISLESDSQANVCVLMIGNLCL